jgi:hypothetical protein
MHHLNSRYKAHSPIYNKWLDIKATYAGPKMEAKHVTMHVLAHFSCKEPKYLLLLLIWAPLHDLECCEVLKLIVTYPMYLKYVA